MRSVPREGCGGSLARRVGETPRSRRAGRGAAPARSCGTSRSRVLHAGPPAGADRCADRPQAIILDESVAVTGINEPLLDFGAVELASGDQLIQTERRAVQPVVSAARRSGGQ